VVGESEGATFFVMVGFKTKAISSVDDGDVVLKVGDVGDKVRRFGMEPSPLADGCLDDFVLKHLQYFPGSFGKVGGDDRGGICQDGTYASFKKEQFYFGEEGRSSRDKRI